MGLVSGLLLLPLAPVRGTIWVADHLLQEALRQAHDPRAVQARLAALNRALDEGAIDEATFEREEERLLAILERQAARPTERTPTTTDHSDRSQRRHV
ncbi:gas vesicle protein GvpG [Streptomyces sp. NPDC050315]|uniref:gas vesicle protein GvpG n=1 Tax=Streptomyces sp. NPDC050315 TaxID=3155039 RepID=UPI0034225B02